MPVNYVLLAVIAGIIGLVLTGFTLWHVHLAVRGQTTIECLEKTRYLSPLRKSMQHQHFPQQNDANGNGSPSFGEQLREIGANAIPGVTRPEEGEERSSPTTSAAQSALYRNYSAVERSRERERYEDYLDEKDSEKLPHAFDLGPRRNLRHLFGETPLLWFLPICNTTGDGWHWEASAQWIEARENVRHEREAQWRAQEQREREAGWGAGADLLPDYSAARKQYQPRTSPSSNWARRDGGERHYLTTSSGVTSVPASGRRSPGKADALLGRNAQQSQASGRPDSGLSMDTLDPYRYDHDDFGDDAGNADTDGEGDHFSVSSNSDDGEESPSGDIEAQKPLKSRPRGAQEWQDWSPSGHE
ncbi:MAG: hypothetical protein M1819_006992 [Sarea resinae]|nr:MAG: hypothetical protein M1819_006992 [Sarea resinae]